MAGLRAEVPPNRLTIFELPGANRLFQAAATGQPEEYATLAKAFAPGVVEAITAWVDAR